MNPIWTDVSGANSDRRFRGAARSQGDNQIVRTQSEIAAAVAVRQLRVVDGRATLDAQHLCGVLFNTLYDAKVPVSGDQVVQDVAGHVR